jgi:hypothetical protein
MRSACVALVLLAATTTVWANPRQRDVVAFDFRLRPDSPNIGAGERGTTIGALPAGREENPLPHTRNNSDGY